MFTEVVRWFRRPFAASVLAVAHALAASPTPSPAQQVHRPLQIALEKIECLQETNEAGSDRPYVLVTAVDLKSAVPQVETVRYGPWAGVDKGEAFPTLPLDNPILKGVPDALKPMFNPRIPFWAIDGKNAKPIQNPNDVVFVVAMMENDDGEPSTLRALVKAAAVASLAASNGQPRAVRVQKLIADINGAMGTPTGFPNFDDKIGGPKELKLSAAEIGGATPPAAKKTLEFQGDGGHYRLTFGIVKK